jgi:hypothetical protein
VVQQDFGVSYDMTAADNFSFKDSRVAFLHGMIPGPNQTAEDVPGGTCASMPVLYRSVGRRLGYPLKLVLTDGHIFVRWDGKGHPNPAWQERFNIEGAGNGFSSFEDEYYQSWPFEVTDQQVKANHYLESLTPAEELAQFLASRGHCGRDNGQFGFAARCYENSYRYDTKRPAYRSWFVHSAQRARRPYEPQTPALARMLQARRQLAQAQGLRAADRPDLPGLSSGPGGRPSSAGPSPGGPRPAMPGSGPGFDRRQGQSPSPGPNVGRAQPNQPGYGQPSPPSPTT